MWVQGPKDLNHAPLLFLAISRGSGSEVQQPEHKPVSGMPALQLKISRLCHDVSHKCFILNTIDCLMLKKSPIFCTFCGTKKYGILYPGLHWLLCVHLPMVGKATETYSYIIGGWNPNVHMSPVLVSSEVGSFPWVFTDCLYEAHTFLAALCESRFPLVRTLLMLF